MSESEALFNVLRQSGDAACVAAIEQAVRDAPDQALCRINALDFAAKHALDEERTLSLIHICPGNAGDGVTLGVGKFRDPIRVGLCRIVDQTQPAELQACLLYTSRCV